MTNAIANLSRPSFSPEFTAWLANADMADLYDAYCEHYKDAHGIKARWIYGTEYSREEFANMFESLGHAIREENKREQEAQDRFTALIASLGLADWAVANGIRTMYDLWDHNLNNEYQTTEPLTKAEQMAAKIGYEGEL
jgi:hypothetical protein